MQAGGKQSGRKDWRRRNGDRKAGKQSGREVRRRRDGLEKQTEGKKAEKMASKAQMLIRQQ